MNTPEKQLPNIILINIDDLGWTDLGSFGSTYYETPIIDGLAEKGLTFTDAYACAANCAPSRACMISGEATPRHGVYTVGGSERGDARTRKLIPTPNTLHLAPGTRTFGHAMADAGYETITLGKWHVGKDPLEQGFKHNVGGCQFGGPYSGGKYHSPYHYPNCEQDDEGEYLTDRLTDEAIDFIGKTTDKPFFMYLPYYTIHEPLRPKPEKKAYFEQREGNEAHNRADYAAMLSALDDNIGRLIATLEELSLDKRTLVFFTSDNGGVWKSSKQWPLRAGKGSYYEGGIRVPTFAYWPGTIEPGQTTNIPITGLDMYPTLLELAGVEKAEDKTLDGDSITSILLGNEPTFDADRPLIWHFPIYLQGYLPPEATCDNCDNLFRTRPGSIIRKGNWKLHQYFEDGRLELYNLEEDLGERTDLSAENPQKTEELLSILNEWRTSTNAPIPTELNPEYDPEYEKLAVQGKAPK